LLTELLDPAALGEESRPNPVSAERTVHVGTDHTAAGNPNRFRCGEVRISPDEEWRSGMSAGNQALVGALTLPGLKRYRLT
jgi:hypothetical protein